MLSHQIKELIDRSHRLGKPKSGEDAKPRPIIIKFVSYSTRSTIFRSKRNLMGTPLITESLTTRRMDLLRKAETQVRDNKLKGAWTQNGRICALDDDDHKVLITKAADLVSTKFPIYSLFYKDFIRVLRSATYTETLSRLRIHLITIT